MRKLLLLALLAAAPASAEIALFSQRDFQGARYSLEAASSNMNFSPRSVRVVDKPWELCPRPFFGGNCLRIDSTRANLSLPRAFSGMVRSARPIADAKLAPEKEPAAKPAKAKPPKAAPAKVEPAKPEPAKPEPPKVEEKPQPKD